MKTKLLLAVLIPISFFLGYHIGHWYGELYGMAEITTLSHPYR